MWLFMICKRDGVDALPLRSFLMTDLMAIDLSDCLSNINSRTSTKSLNVAGKITVLVPYKCIVSLQDH